MTYQFLIKFFKRNWYISILIVTSISLKSCPSLFSTTITKSSSLARLLTSSNLSAMVLTIYIIFVTTMLSFMNLVISKTKDMGLKHVGEGLMQSIPNIFGCFGKNNKRWDTIGEGCKHGIKEKTILRLPNFVL